MPRRATKRGEQRTPLNRDCDVLICGASFAGLAVARELAGSGADVLMIDRYEIGERQTSACGIPTGWLEVLGLQESLQQTFPELVIHTPHLSVRYDLPWTFSTFDYRTLCRLLAEQTDCEFETAKVDGVSPSGLDGVSPNGLDGVSPNGLDGVSPNGLDGVSPNGSTLGESAGADSLGRVSTGADSLHVVHTDRGDIRAPLIVDALGWRRVLGGGEAIQPPDAYLSRGLEVHPHGAGADLEVWIDRSYVPAGYGWSFPAENEIRVGVGSFDPRFHVKEPTVRLAEDLSRDPVRYQGNWIPHKIREATEGGIFFAGDSAGHCLPLTAEGIRTALYFGIACGRELRAVHAGRRTRTAALANYGAFSASHTAKFDWLLRIQRLVPRVPPRVLAPSLRAIGTKRFVDWSFGHYLNIAHPDYATARARAPVGTIVPAAA